MRRSYVPIFQDKEYNSQIFFDYEANEFFTTPEQKNSSITYLSGFVGIILYSFLKNVSFDIGLDPLTLVFLSIMIGLIISIASIKLIMNVTNKGLKKSKILIIPTREQIKEYIYEGRKQSKKLLYMNLFLFFLSLMCSIILYFMPDNVLFIFITPASWVIAIIATWAVRPVKKIKVYKQLEKL